MSSIREGQAGPLVLRRGPVPGSESGGVKVAADFRLVSL
jgi:hypothetical protein